MSAHRDINGDALSVGTECGHIILLIETGEDDWPGSSDVEFAAQEALALAADITAQADALIGAALPQGPQQ